MGAFCRLRASRRGSVRAGTALGTALVLVLGAGGPASSGAPVDRRRDASGAGQGCLDPVLPAPARGEAAVRALGANVISVAARHGTNPRDLATQLREDRTLWVDECGALLFQDELPADLEPGPEVASTEGAGWPVTIAAEDAFALHSRPGSNRVLYLDFDGHEISSSAWNAVYSQDTWTAPPFSTDGDPSTFSASERSVVIDVWRRVAQDYAPFDIDVTTQDPGAEAITRSGSADALFGTRVLISPDATQAQCGCGGRAYINVVDRTSNHAYSQPAWVYPQAVANNAKYIADAASHEAGHNFGLSHDGTQSASYFGGSQGWGPIMGAPYGQPVTQWSNGSYPGANNFQDDLALISGNGAPLLPDDVVAPAALTLPGSTPGLINGPLDVDDFTIQAPSGTLTISVAPHWPGPNLDAGLVLRDAAGAVVATSAPAYSGSAVQASIGASIVVPVAAGTYTASVEGTGNGVAGSAGESEDGSIGWYTLTASTTATAVDPTPPPTPTPTPTPTPPAVSPSPPTQVTPQAQPEAPAVTIAALTIETTTLPRAKRKKRYRATLEASGGVAPYSWRKTKRSLPKGLKLKRSGAIQGKAKARASRKIRVRVTDSVGTRTTAWIRIRVR